MLTGYKMTDGTPAGQLAASGDITAADAEPSGVGHDGSEAPSLPAAIIVASDIAKGATVTLVTRDIEPKISAVAPLPNPEKPTAGPETPTPGSR
jgi:hypothetical protein